MREAPTIADHLCEPCARALRRGPGRARRGGGRRTSWIRRLVRGLDYYTRTAFEFVSGGLLGSSAGDRLRGRALRRARRGARRAAHARASASRWVSIACCSPWTRRRRRTPASPVPAVLRRGGESGRSDRAGAGDWSESSVRRRAAPPQLRGTPLKAQLKMADRAGAAYAAIVGERELADGHRDASPPGRRRAGVGGARRPPGTTRRRDDVTTEPSMRTAMRSHTCGGLRAADAGTDGHALRLGRAPPRSRRRDVHRPPRPRGHRPGRVPPRRGAGGARRRAGSRRRGRRPRDRRGVRARPDGMENPGARRPGRSRSRPRRSRS